MTGPRTDCPTALAAAVCAALAAGCGVYGEIPRAEYVPGAAARLPGALFAADDEAPEIIPRLLRPVEEPEGGPAFDEEPRGRRGRIGLRVGYLMPASAETGDWDPALDLGLYLRLARRAVCELGVDYVALAADHEKGASASSHIYFFRCDVLFGRWRGAERGATVYLAGGAGVGLESAEWEPTGETADRTGASVNLGLGVGSGAGSWDARVVYSILAGSDNVPGAVTAAFGYSF